MLYHTPGEDIQSVLSAHGVQQRMKGRGMKAKEKKISNELRPEYNFDYSKAVRGKYYKRI